MPQPLTLSATVDIKAQRRGAPSIVIEGYNGGLMSAAPYGLLAIDLNGAVLPPQVPILIDHDSSLQGIIGYGVPSVSAGRLIVSGTLLNTPAANQVRELARGGLKLQASIGYEPTASVRPVRSGESVTVNGQTLTSDRPWVLVPAGRLREISVLAVAADATTAVHIEGKAMESNFRSWLESQGFKPESLTEQQLAPLRAAWSIPAGHEPDAEQQRVAAIQRIAASVMTDKQLAAAVADEAILSGWTPEQASATLLERIRAARPTNVAIHAAGGNGYVDTFSTLQASLHVMAGQDELAAQTFGERAVEAARRKPVGGFMGWLRAALAASGREVPSTSGELIKAAFSTSEIATALGNTINRSLEQAYREAPATWRAFASVRSANDFKQHTAIRPSFVGQLEQVGPGGEIKHGHLEESTFQWHIDTFARMLKVTRQDLINDDLSFIAETPTLMAKMAVRAVSDLVYQTLLSAGGFFDESLGNLYDDAAAGLSVESLAVAVRMMRQQRDDQGNDLDLVPRTLVVPPELEITARAILESVELQLESDTSGPTGNALRGAAALQVEPRLSNSDRFTGTSAKAWYLFASPQDAPIIVGFLQGRQTPVVEFFGMDHDVNTLGVAWRIYHDFGCALGDFRAAVKSLGEASSQ